MSMAQRAGGIGLEYLSVFGLPLPDYVVLAGKLGCDFVSITFGRPANPYSAAGILGHNAGMQDRASWCGETLRESASLRQTLASALADNDLYIEQVEGFGIMPHDGVAHYAHDLDAIARLGARTICAVSMDPDIGRTKARFVELADMAQERGLLLTTEVGAGVICDFERGRLLWSKLQHPNFALSLDTMHFFRTGAKIEHLSHVPDGMVGHVQLCDAPLPDERPFVQDEAEFTPKALKEKKRQYLEEALFERRLPGQGDLPLKAFLARIPKGVPVGLEVPIRSALEAGISLEDSLSSCVSRARRLMSAVLV